MATARKKKSKVKRSPLTGWFGKKPDPEEEQFPAMNLEAGLDRAMRGANVKVDQSGEEDERFEIIRDTLSIIESALYAIDGIREILEQACDIANSARDAGDAGGRALLAESYDELRLSIDATIKKIDPRASILIGKSQRHIDIFLGDKARYSVSPVRLDISEKGLALPPPRHAFESDDEIDQTLLELDRALHRADKAAAGYCRDAQYLIARLNAANQSLATAS